MRQIKFRIWNTNGKCFHDWRELVEKNKIHLLANQQSAYPVMQFTGLTDKSGAEIYEGDILKSDIGLLWLVSFGSRGGFVAHEKNDIDDFVLLDDYDFAVIGNIYQNPELLK